jgi:hypothetical protein
LSNGSEEKRDKDAASMVTSQGYFFRKKCQVKNMNKDRDERGIIISTSVCPSYKQIFIELLNVFMTLEATSPSNILTSPM